MLAQLVKAANLAAPGASANKRRVLVTDSHYAYEEQAVEIDDDCGMGFLATYTLPSKKTTADRSAAQGAKHPFYKFTSALDAKIPRGMHRFAFKRMESSKRGAWLMRVAVKDKRRFGLMSTVRLGEPKRVFSMKRRVRGLQHAVDVRSFPALLKYLSNFNGVDLMDRGISEFTSLYRINRFYLLLFCYSVDTVMFSLWKIVLERIPA